MTQKHLKFGSFEAPEVDEDGYSLSYATTSSDDSGNHRWRILVELAGVEPASEIPTSSALHA